MLAAVRLSVVIPVYNEADQLVETIASASATLETDLPCVAEIVVAETVRQTATARLASPQPPTCRSGWLVNAALALASLRRPLVKPAALAAVGVAAGAAAAAKGRRRDEIASVAKLGPVYALGHGLGMWRGLAILAHDAVRSRR